MTLIYNFEYELKLMLSEEEYMKLLETEGEETVLQVNHYFDTPVFGMWDKGTVIRIRDIKSSFEITVKKKKEGRDAIGVLSMDEYTRDISQEVASDLIKGRQDIKEFLPEDYVYSNAALKKVGSIATFRKKIRINEELPMAELDKSIYSDLVDYELEWEIDDKDYREAVRSLANLGLDIKGRDVGKSKYGRLIDSMRKGNK